MTTTKIQKWIVIPDLHVPFTDTKSLAAVEKLMTDYQFDGYLQLGDLMDFNCISPHNINNLRAVEGQRILSDYKVAGQLLDRHQRMIGKNNPQAKFIILEGSHDERIQRYINANPAVEGLLEVPTALGLDRRGIEWVPYWSTGKIYKIGKAIFIHGRYCNDHHAKKHVMRYGCDVFYGHVHDIQAYSLEQYGSTLIGQSLGCLCAPQAYMQGRPDRWQQAVTIFEFLPEGNFQYQVIRICGHKCAYNGKVYRG
jgi:predicted phosphodiesterase